MSVEKQQLNQKVSALRWIFRTVVVLVAIGAGLVIFLERDNVLAALTDVLIPDKEEPVPVATLEKGPFQLEVPAFGEIVGMESVPVPTPYTPAGSLKIARLIPEGTFVEVGDTVVIFDKTDAQLAIEVQENTLAANQEQTKVTSSEHETNEKVLEIDRTDAELEYDFAMNVLPDDESIFSRWEIIEAQINADLAKDKMGFLDHKGRVQRRVARADEQILAIEKNRAQMEMDMAKRTLNALELKTNATGLAVYRLDRRREPQVGDESMPGRVLIDIIDLGTFQARIFVLERDAGSLSRGKKVNVRLDAIPGKVFEGTIRSVSALAQSLERNSPLKYFTCDVAIQNVGESAKLIKPGMTVKADVVLESYESCFLVPASAVTQKDTESVVYIQNGETFEPRTVQVGSGTHGQYAILSGVETGESVALRNPFETRRSYLPDFSKVDVNSGGGGRRGFGRPH